MSVLHAGLLNQWTKVPSVQLAPSPQARTDRQVARHEAATLALGCSIHPRSSHAPKVLLVTRGLAKAESWVRDPLGAPALLQVAGNKSQLHNAPLSERLGPGLPNRRAGFDSLAVLNRRRSARRPVEG
jgi:hypothetical protein